jgi:DNA-binding TFAR19-related protein (PDSD5 family)
LVEKMAGNPKDSKWYSLARADRKRKKLEVTLSPEAREKLERMKARHPDRTLSAVVEDLILAAKEK